MKRIAFNDTQILIGENKNENWELLDNNQGTYYWFHLKSFPSCHVIVQSDDITDELIRYAATLCKSNTKYKNQRNIKVNYTPISNIKKADAIGSVCFISNRKVNTITVSD